MSHVILGLFLCFLLISGLAQGYNIRPVKFKMTSYCLSFRGKCQPRCDLSWETEVVKLRPFCGGELRCCVGRPPARPEATKKTSGSPGVSVYTSFLTPSPSVKTFSTTSHAQMSPGLSSISRIPQSTSPPLPSPSGFTFAFQNAETKTNKTFASYSRYRKPQGCGVPVLGRVRRIVGGSKAERCLFPWMVYILRDPGKDDLCGGTLVSDRHVITAAHCYDNLGDNWPALYIGEYNRRDNNSKTKFVTSSYNVARHPGYSRITFSYDIAILTLNIPIPLENYECLYPICLPGAGHAVKVGDTCTVAGWGSTSRTQYNPAVSSPSLMKTQIVVLNDTVCQGKFGNYFNGRSQICAGDLTGKTDSCVGDSGGPFMCSMTNNINTSTKKMPVQFLMGVISSGGTPCAQADTPALYTDLQEVREWIRSVLN